MKDTSMRKAVWSLLKQGETTVNELHMLYRGILTDFNTLEEIDRAERLLSLLRKYRSHKLAFMALKETK